MFAMAVQTQSVWMQVVGSALLGLLAVSWLSVMRRSGGITLTMHAPTEVVVGVSFDIQLVLHNAGKKSTAPLRIRYQVFAEPPLIAPFDLARFHEGRQLGEKGAASVGH